MKACICQPEHLPWLGWFDKAAQVDVLVLLDNVQYKKRYFENRNKIRTPQGWVWLTVPVLSKGRFTQDIKDVEIDPTVEWQPQHWKAIEMNYRKARYFSSYGDELKELYLGRKWTKLADLNTALIEWGLSRLSLAPKVMKGSELGVDDRSSILLARLCEKIGADVYLSGISGKDYLEESEFSSRGVRVEYQAFRHPIYSQHHGDFEPCMSFIDLVFNAGPEAGRVLRFPAQRLDKVFT